MWDILYKIYSGILCFGLVLVGLADYSFNGCALAMYGIWMVCINYFPDEVEFGIKSLLKIR